MKRAIIFFLAALVVSSGTNAQDLVVEYESEFNRAFRSELVEIRTLNDVDLEEDGIPEIVFIEEDDDGNQIAIRALDGRTRVQKWELDLTNLAGNGINKLSSTNGPALRKYGLTALCDTLIWRGFRRIRNLRGIGKSTRKSERLAIFAGQRSGVLLIDPATNDVLLDVGEDFLLLSIFDVDDDGLDEVLIGDKPRRVVMVYGDGTISSVESGEPFVPAGFHLAQNYPNPFNPTTTIRYSVEQAGEIDLKIYNMLGQVVRTLVQCTKLAGDYSIVWDGQDDGGNRVASGHYFYQLKAGEFQSTRRMILLK